MKKCQKTNLRRLWGIAQVFNPFADFHLILGSLPRLAAANPYSGTLGWVWVSSDEQYDFVGSHIPVLFALRDRLILPYCKGAAVSAAKISN
jgi:hypothetical protein